MGELWRYSFMNWNSAWKEKKAYILGWGWGWGGGASRLCPPVSRSNLANLKSASLRENRGNNESKKWLKSSGLRFKDNWNAESKSKLLSQHALCCDKSVWGYLFGICSELRVFSSMMIMIVSWINWEIIWIPSFHLTPITLQRGVEAQFRCRRGELNKINQYF